MAASSDWHVIGRAEKDTPRIIVECQLTGRLGYVLTFTKEQWDRAGQAMLNHMGWDAYRWNPKCGDVTELTASATTVA